LRRGAAELLIIMIILDDVYSEESLQSLQEDVWDTINEAKRCKEIDVDGNGFCKGTFTVKLIWNDEE
jgi:hypothetical protein